MQVNVENGKATFQAGTITVVVTEADIQEAAKKAPTLGAFHDEPTDPALAPKVQQHVTVSADGTYPNAYNVIRYDNGTYRCGCLDFAFRGAWCKHILRSGI